ncbi:MAG: cytochrome c3 family protein [Deltaproteobacteria bacterium]|nr:cytochrome c3 family protein [Deltaproteobacteria bacterium]
MNTIVRTALCTALTLGLSLGAALAADAPKGPVKVTNFGKKAAVTFDHGKHKDVKCEQCHHNAKDGKFTCGECHRKDDDAKTKAPKLESAAHNKDVGVCFSCHRAEDAKHKLKCNDCHKG